MRSSKSRSRNKSNRNRSVGNIVNRVFDSSGPEGKVRGTPQQIIDKYSQLARDAALSNDRVAAENFQQHAEHYTRLLGEAMRDAEARREQMEAQNRDRQQNRDAQQSSNNTTSEQPRMVAADPASAPQPDVIDIAESESSGLVETPESRPAPETKPDTPSAEPAPGEAPKAEAAPKAERPKRPRKPRTRAPKATETDAAPAATEAAPAADTPAAVEAPAPETASEKPTEAPAGRQEAAE